MKLKILLALLMTLVTLFSACGGETADSSVADSSEEAVSSEESSEEVLEFVPFIAKAVKKDDGIVTVTVSLPANVSFGCVCLSVSKNLEYVADSMKSDIGATINPAYSKDGLDGQYATFASIESYDEGAVVFTADYRITGDSAGAEDFTFPKWEHGNELKLVSDQNAGTMTVDFN